MKECQCSTREIVPRQSSFRAASTLPIASIVKPTPASRLVTISAAAGIIGPILFSVVVIVLGYFWTGYNHLTQAVSELGATNAPNMSIQALNFFIIGILTVVFAVGLALHDRRFRSTSVLVGVYGLGASLAAVLPCDPGCPVTGTSIVQVAHNLDALISFIGLGVAPLLFWRSGKTVLLWSKTAGWSLRVAVGSISLLIGYLIIDVLSLSPYTGLLQRIFLGLLFAWVIMMVVRLFQVNAA